MSIFVCYHYHPMSNGFKITLATIFLVVMVVFSGLFSVMLTMARAWGGGCSGLECLPQWLAMAVGPVALVFYILFLKTKRDLFFWFSAVPFIALVIVGLISHILGKI